MRSCHDEGAREGTREGWAATDGTGKDVVIEFSEARVRLIAIAGIGIGLHVECKGAKATAILPIVYMQTRAREFHHAYAKTDVSWVSVCTRLTHTHAHAHAHVLVVLRVSLTLLMHRSS